MITLSKLSVKVDIPALSREYEFSVPEVMSVFDAQKLMVRILNSEYGVSDNITNLMLMDPTDGKALRAECSFRQLGIQDGAKLILF